MSLSTHVLNAFSDGVLTLDGLVGRLGCARRDLVKAVQGLQRRGLVRVHETPDGRPGSAGRGQYTLTEAGLAWAESGQPIAPGQGARPRQRPPGLRARAWWHLRAHRLATLQDLLTTQAEGTEAAADRNVYKYLCALERAGILARSAPRRPARQSRGDVPWRLVRDLGPQAPVWRETARVVYDPNGGALLPIEPAAGGRRSAP